MSLIQAARGHAPADLLITNVRLANVFTGEVYPVDIVIADGRIAAVEEPGSLPHREARETLDGGGRIAVPGLVDSHLHIESSLLAPGPFAEAVLRRGTTTVAEDPHEIANAVGLPGVRAFWEASQGLPLHIHYLASTCVPAAEGLETCQGVMGPAEIAEMLAWDGVLGLAEVMDARAVIDETPGMTAILEEGRRAGGVIEGHNPMLRGRELNAYVAAGIDSDHTLMTPALLRDKARLGVCLQLQERYLSEDLIAALLDLPELPRFNLVTDDVSPDYLEECGHLDQVLRHAIALGLPPMPALRAATIEPARRLRLYDRGAIAPGYLADVVLVDRLERFEASTTVCGGRVVVRDGNTCWDVPAAPELDALRNSINLSPVTADAFRLDTPIDNGVIDVRAIVSHTPGTTTEAEMRSVEIVNGLPILPDEGDLSLIAVLARGGGSRFVGLVRGLGLRAGAVATTHAHDSHNLAVIGRDPESMATAANAVIAAEGGIAVAVGPKRGRCSRCPSLASSRRSHWPWWRPSFRVRCETRCATSASTTRTCSCASPPTPFPSAPACALPTAASSTPPPAPTCRSSWRRCAYERIHPAGNGTAPDSPVRHGRLASGPRLHGRRANHAFRRSASDDRGADPAVHRREHGRRGQALRHRPLGRAAADRPSRVPPMVQHPHLRDRLGAAPCLPWPGIRHRGRGRDAALRVRNPAPASSDRHLPAGKPGLLAGDGKTRHAARRAFPQGHVLRGDTWWDEYFYAMLEEDWFGTETGKEIEEHR